MKLSKCSVVCRVASVNLLAGAVFLAVGCSKPAAPQPELAGGTGGAAGQAGAKNPSGDFGGKTPEQALDQAIETAFQTVYFDFDSSLLTEQAQENLRLMARALKADATLRLVIEGHSDARGSNEYNLALSLKRAEAIRDFLSTEGVDKNALTVASKGEESPAAEGMTEEAFAKNRRGEFRKEKSGS
jgi:peptidoglycan-associated lipoprotein